MQTRTRDFEILVRETYESILRPGDVAVDVGAHQGRHAFAMAERVYPGGRVLAFEPLPMCREVIVTELAAYFPELEDVLSILPYAVGAASGESEFVIATEALAYSGLRERAYDWPTKLQRIPIQVRRLDDICLDLDRLHFIKIDAEGGEFDILRGAAGCLAKYRPVVAFECGMRALAAYQTDPKDIGRFWAEHGYHVYDVLAHKLSPDSFVVSTRAQDVWDYVAVPAERSDLENLLYQRLSQPTLWQAVASHLGRAEDRVAGADAVPLLLQYRVWQRTLLRGLARLGQRATRFITRPQAGFNESVVRALRGLLRLVRARDEVIGHHAATIGGLMDQVRRLEERVRELASAHDTSRRSAERAA